MVLLREQEMPHLLHGRPLALGRHEQAEPLAQDREPEPRRAHDQRDEPELRDRVGEQVPDHDRDGRDEREGVERPDRLAASGDPWADMDDDPQDIGELVERFTDTIADCVPDAPWPPVYPKMPNEPPRVAPSRAKKPKAE